MLLQLLLARGEQLGLFSEAEALGSLRDLVLAELI